MGETLSSYEKETIIHFTKAEDTAHIFTYEKTWQAHLEKKLGLKPVMDNGFGGKEYELPKNRIKPPRAPKALSQQAKQNLASRLNKGRQQKLNLSPNSHSSVGKSRAKRKNKGKSL